MGFNNTMNKLKKSFLQGAAGVIADIISIDGPCTRTEEMLKTYGLDSREALEIAEISDYDKQILLPVIEEFKEV